MNACLKAATDNKSKKCVPHILLLSILPDNVVALDTV